MTDPRALHYHGATVGSNNTGEVTAIIEALEYAHTHDHTAVTVYSDSEWAINVIKGRWRAKANRNLVHHAQKLVTQTGLKVHLHWVKSHQGTEGSEMADRLAHRGKTNQARQGDHSAVVPILPVKEDQIPPRSAQIGSGYAERSATGIPIQGTFPHQTLDHGRNAQTPG